MGFAFWVQFLIRPFGFGFCCIGLRLTQSAEEKGFSSQPQVAFHQLPRLLLLLGQPFHNGNNLSRKPLLRVQALTLLHPFCSSATVKIHPQNLTQPGPPQDEGLVQLGCSPGPLCGPPLLPSLWCSSSYAVPEGSLDPHCS